MAYFIPVSDIEQDHIHEAAGILGPIADEQDHKTWGQLMLAFGSASLLKDMGAASPLELPPQFALLPDTTTLTPHYALTATFFSGIQVHAELDTPLVRAAFTILQLDRPTSTVNFQVQHAYVGVSQLASFAAQPPTPEFNTATRKLQAAVLPLMDAVAKEAKRGTIRPRVTLLTQ